MIKLFQIEGDSLYPLLQNGQRVLCIKLFGFMKLQIGDIVVFAKKGYPKMIKKIHSIQNNQYFLQGTTVQSIDSRDFGLIEKKEIFYKVLFRIKFF